MKQPIERRLAAILAMDVVGYSRLMGTDEEGTLERLKSHRRELIDPKITEHRGRIVKTMGDGLLAEFPSVVDAVRCAVKIQRAMIDRNRHGYATVSPALKYTVMERSSDASAEVVTLQFDPAEVLALYGFLALGAHFAAVISGEDSPFSPDEIRSHIATIGETASDTLMAKLVEAGTAVRDRARLPTSSPSIDET
jgi:hypothetical protein